MSMTHATAPNANATIDTYAAPSSSELRRVNEEIESIKRESAALVGGLTDEALRWRSVPGKWSIADCFAHINVVNRDYYFKAIRRAMSEARAQNIIGAEPFRHGFFGNLFIRLTDPPVRFRVPAPRAFVPPAEYDAREVVAQFMRSQDELQSMLREADGFDLGRVKVVSPVNKRLKFTLGQAFRLLTAHERRHLWQARNVRNAPNFPAP